MAVAPLTSDRQVLLGDLALGFATAVTALRATVTDVLGPGKPLLAAPIMTGVLNHRAIGVRQKNVQPDIHPSARMLADGFWRS